MIEANALLNRAIIRADKWDHKPAIDDLNLSIDLEQSPEAYQQLGRVYKQSGNNQDSLKNYEKAANLFQEIRNVKDYRIVRECLRS